MALITLLDDLWWKWDVVSRSIRAFLDFSTAFDTINLGILDHFQELGVGSTVLFLLGQFQLALIG